MKHNIPFLGQGLLTALLLVSAGCGELLAQSGIYVGGHFRRERTHTVNDLKASGFTYVILFNINVEANGDLTTDGQTICSNGSYVFGSTNPNYVADVTALKNGATSINRVESCIGGWGNHSYANIRSLVSAQGTGTGSILYRNFRALKSALPTMDAINNDDEEAYDVASATAFHILLADLGFKTTLAPYMNKAYWQALATNVNNQRAGAVDKVYLQWYEGGAGNNPCDWNLNGIELHTGDLNYENATTVANKMTSAKNSCGAKGGFLWVYNDNNINLPDLAGRINAIYNSRPPSPVATFYKDCPYAGTPVALPVGDYNLTQLQARGLANDALSSLTVNSGYEVQLFQDDNFLGGSVVINANTSCFSADWNDKASSLKVRAIGGTTAFTRQLEAEVANVNNGMTVEACAEGGQDMGYIDAGDYLVWNSVNIPASGSYKIEYRVASGAAGGTISSDLNAGAIQFGNTTIPGTGGWQNWTTVSKTVTITAGTYNFGVFAQTGGYNINWVRISKVAAKGALASVSANSAQTLELYPNPVTDKLHLSAGLTLVGSNYCIVNATGQRVASGSAAGGSISVAALSAGIYTLLVTTNDQQTLTRRFVK
jgi:hypothetical protein